MDYYIYNPGGSDRGPFRLEQLQKKLASRAVDPKTRIRSGASEGYRPLSEVLDSPSSSGEDVASPIRPFRGSSLSGWFISFAILDFIGAAVGPLMAFMGSDEAQLRRAGARVASG